MTYRAQMLAVLNGKPTGRIPWVPRMDLWYKMRHRAGALPEPFQSRGLRGGLRALGWGCHAIVPDFQDTRRPEDDAHRALGVYNLGCMPVRTEFEGVAWTLSRDGDYTYTTYKTPKGALRTGTLYDARMRDAGITISHVTEFAVKTVDDLDAAACLFDRARVLSNAEGYSRYNAAVGEEGLAAAFVNSAGSPMHLLQRELMPLDLFFETLYTHPERLAYCAQAVGGYFEQLFAAAAQSEAELMFLGANYDASVTYPPFFEEHITPWLRRFADLLHGQGKWLLTHTDGENRGLVQCYLDSAVDVADSICPAPMTRLTFKQVRDAFGGRITIAGGIPSVALLEDSMPDPQFDAFLDAFFAELGAGDHLILGISDTTPPGASLERLQRIAERVAVYQW